MNMAPRRSLRAMHPWRVDIVFLILLSAWLLVMGLKLPILTVRKLWEGNTFSVLSGIQNLWHDRYYFLALVIFFFSIVFPIAKLFCLFVVWFIRLKDEQRQKILYFLEILGKWSMLDVFVAAIIIVTIKLGALVSAKAESGLYFFGASILVAMLVSGMQNSLVRRK